MKRLCCGVAAALLLGIAGPAFAQPDPPPLPVPLPIGPGDCPPCSAIEERCYYEPETGTEVCYPWGDSETVDFVFDQI